MARVDPRENLYGKSKVYTGVNNENYAHYYYDLDKAPYGTDGVPLAVNEPGSKHCLVWKIPGAGHALTIGANRSGKDSGCIIPAMLTYGGSAVVIDPKAEVAWATHQHRKRLGHKVVIIDPWNEVNRRYGDQVGIRVPLSKFNPLSVLNPNSPEFADDITQLAGEVIITAGSDNPHWPESARELVSGLIAAVVEEAPGVASFNDVRRLLLAPDHVLEQTVKDVVSLNPESLAGRKLARFVGNGGKPPTTEISSIRSTAITQTAIFDAATLLASMETTPDAFNLSELVTHRASLYLVLPPDKLFTHGRWLRLMLSLVNRAIVSAPKPPDFPVLMILNELGTITPGLRGGGIPMVAQAAGLTAGLGIRLWCFFQDITQLQRDYPESWETFIGNAAMVQLVRVNESSTAKYFSDYLGTMTLQSGGDVMWGPITISTGGAVQYHPRPVRLPQEIIQMEPGQTLVMFSGAGYYQMKQTPYFRESRFDGRYLPNPNYPLPAWAIKANVFPGFVGQTANAPAAAVRSVFGWLRRGKTAPALKQAAPAQPAPASPFAPSAAAAFFAMGANMTYAPTVDLVALKKTSETG